MITPFLLHAANRNIKSKAEIFIKAFYEVKDEILKRGKWIGYDVQHIKGKRCNSCDGKGNHPKYGYNGKVYDHADCYHCFAGWYKMPIWVCLRRIQFGRYVFHKPLKREEHIGNPFTKDSLGWEVTNNPVIEGYIDHEKHWFGGYAIFILLWFYNRSLAKSYFKDEFDWWIGYQVKRKFRLLKTWNGWIIHKPKIQIRQYYDEQFQHYDDLPF